MKTFVQKTGWLTLCVWVALAARPASAADPEMATPASTPRVYVIPIRGMIEKGLVYVIRRGVLEAETGKADAVVITMDTPGGAVDATEDIIRILQRLTVPSYTLVEHNAISAGAIIALSTDHIYMTPGSKIGDAMPIMADPTGGVLPLPDAEREKITAYVDTMIRAAAEQRGHDKELASSMVRRELGYEVDGEVICPEGQLLTLTNVEAERLVGKPKRPLLSEGTVASLEELLARVGLAGGTVTELEVTASEQVARFIAALAPLFLMAGLLGIYLEFKTPGFGVAGLLGLLSLAVYLWGHHVAGLAGMEDVALLIIGIALILVEVLFLPGFGFFGMAGLLIVIWALLSAMVEQLPGDPWYPTWPQLHLPIRNFVLAGILAALGAAGLAKYLPQSRAMRPLVLGASISRAAGYSASRLHEDLLGRRGSALTDLRPSGAAQFDDRRIDVVTHGEYVERGTPVRVVETHGNRIVVEGVSSSGA